MSQATDIYVELAAEARRIICEMASERIPCGYCGARPGEPCRRFTRDSSVFDCYAHAGRWMEYMMTEENIDTPDIIAGAVQYVKCDFCGVKEGADCVIKLYQGGAGRPLPDFAHVSRRMEYVQWRDVFGPATRKPAVVVEEKKFHAYVETMKPCSKPRRHCSSCSQCTCGAPLTDHVDEVAIEPLPVKKSSSDVDDLLG
jgi:hypothetical protein